MEVQVDLDTSAFEEALRAAFDELRAQVGEATELTADHIKERAQALAPKRTHRLEESIDRGPLERKGAEFSVEVHAGGPGVREAIPMEFGTYKDRPHPYMRPAFASAAGALRSAGVAAKLSSSSRARMAVRRARARAVIRHQQRRGVLTARQARAVSRQIGNVVRERTRRKR